MTVPFHIPVQRLETPPAACSGSPHNATHSASICMSVVIIKVWLPVFTHLWVWLPVSTHLWVWLPVFTHPVGVASCVYTSGIVSRIYSLVPTPGEKRSGKQSRISWAYPGRPMRLRDH